MANLNLLKIISSELLTRHPRTRRAEPCLTMNEPAQVQAYLEAGSETGSMAPIYLFNTTASAPLIRPGDLVLDLACGPANQLAQFAAVNPQARFVGVDLSEEMLNRASGVVARRNLKNVSFELSDITQLERFADNSVDVVVSTLALHHLPDRNSLASAFREIRRVLKPDGRVYLHDLGALRSERSVREFAQQYAAGQPEVFNVDYLNSLLAAFAVTDFRAAMQPLAATTRLHTTFMFPYMIVIRSRTSSGATDPQRTAIESIRERLSSDQRSDLRKLGFFFRLGGLAI